MSKMSSIGRHAALDVEVEADRLLCGLNVATSIPAEDITVRIHLDKVSFEIVLCGLVKLRVSFPLKGWVRLRYFVRYE